MRKRIKMFYAGLISLILFVNGLTVDAFALEIEDQLIDYKDDADLVIDTNVNETDSLLVDEDYHLESILEENGADDFSEFNNTDRDSVVTGNDIYNYAKNFIGQVTYNGASTDIYNSDCSGFICHVYQHFNMDLWPYRYDLSGAGTNIGTDISNAQIGDIIQFHGHVGLYAGNNRILDCQSPDSSGFYEYHGGTAVYEIPLNYLTDYGYPIWRIIRVIGSTNTGEEHSTPVDSIVVSNATELENALGPNRTIILNDGIYSIPYELLISDCDNLTITAKNPGKAEILSGNLLSMVIWLQHSKNVTISGLILGHDTEGTDIQDCGDDGTVFHGSDCDNLQINNCDLYGCGVEGISLFNAKNCTINNCVIRDCEYSSITILSAYASFNDCIISGNGRKADTLPPYTGYGERGYSIDGSESSYYGPSSVTLNRCKMFNDLNPYHYNSKDGLKVKYSSCSFSDNKFDKKTPQKYGVCLNGLTWRVVNDILEVGYTIYSGNGEAFSNKATEILPYSSSALPWRDAKYSSYDVHSGITYNESQFHGENISGTREARGGDYSITYVLNGGTNNPDNPDSFMRGNAKIALKAPTRTGYKFVGWYSDPNFKKKISAIPKNSTADVTAYAKWSNPISYPITYNLNGGKLSGQIKSYTVEMEDYTLPEPTKQGYKFAGWYSSKDFSGSKITAISTKDAKKVVLYAAWTYQIVYDANCEDVEGSMAADTFTSGKASPLTNNGFIRTGFALKQWTTSPDGKGKKLKNGAILKNNPLPKNGDTITLYADWEGSIYSILFNSNGGTGKMSEMKNCKYGKTYTLSKNKFKRPGYNFMGWNTKPDGSGDSYSDEAIVSNLTTANKVCVDLFAQWGAQTYSIEYKNTEGIENTNPTSYMTKDTPISLKSVNKQGFTFNGWYSDEKLKSKAKSPEIPKDSEGNKIFYAKFTEKICKITFYKNDNTKTKRIQTLKYSEKLPTYSLPNGKLYFSEWNTKADGTGNSYGNEEPVSNIIEKEGSTVTLYAQWTDVKGFKNIPTYYGYQGNGCIQDIDLNRDGCFVYSVAMLLHNYGTDTTPTSVYNDLVNNTGGYGFNLAVLNGIYKDKYGVNISSEIALTGTNDEKKEQLKNALENDYPMGLMVQCPGHAIYVYLLNGEIKAHDPYSASCENVDLANIGYGTLSSYYCFYGLIKVEK